MASRILTFVSCTVYFFLVIVFTIIGFASLIVGAIGLAYFIPAYSDYITFNNNTCLIIDLDYDSCSDSYYCVTWSVEYLVPYTDSSRLVFSTISNKYESLDKALDKMDSYNIITRHKCYYNTKKILNVRWEEPPSPNPYFIMMTIGLGLNIVYIITIAMVSLFQSLKSEASFIHHH